MKTSHYAGFGLTAAAYLREDTYEWQVYVVIAKHHGDTGQTLEKSFIAGETRASKESAEERSIELGRQIIDGKYPERTLTDLVEAKPLGRAVWTQGRRAQPHG